MKSSRSAFNTSACVVHIPCGNLSYALKAAVLEQLGRQRSRVGKGNNLVVRAVHNECRDVDHLQILREVGFGERFDAFIVRLGAAHHTLSPPVLDHAGDRLGARSVETVERTRREIHVELSTVGGERLAKLVEHLDWQPSRIGRRPHHDRRYGADQDEFCSAPSAVASNVTGRFSATRGVADMDGVSQVEMLHHCRCVGRVVVHVMSLADLRGTAVAATVVGDDAEPVHQKEQHLRVPVIRTQWPAVMEDDRLAVFRPPVLVVDFCAVLGRDRAHRSCSFAGVGSDPVPATRQFEAGRPQLLPQCRRA